MWAILIRAQFVLRFPAFGVGEEGGLQRFRAQERADVIGTDGCKTGARHGIPPYDDGYDYNRSSVPE
ncbi:MAG: hypothetical protein ACKO1F_08590, partial [Flammeovirgaceae bacterium]